MLSALMLNQICTEETHHADVESIQQVKGQGGDEVNKEPGGDVMNADGAGVVHNLTRCAHEGGSKVQHNVCRGRQRRQELTQQEQSTGQPGREEKLRVHVNEEHTEFTGSCKSP